MNKETKKQRRQKRKPTLTESIVLVLLIVAVAASFTLLGLKSVLMMVTITILAVIMGLICGYSWKEMSAAGEEKVRKSASVMMLLLVIGMMLAAFMYSGTLPMVLYYGIKLVNPSWLALSGFLLCSVFSLATGTSNGSASTAGFAIMSIAAAMGDAVNFGLVAGACYAGSMLGDKMSPLSDTTILASMITENDIFDHIRHMSKTVGPAALITIIIYVIYGAMNHGATTSVDGTAALLSALETLYSFNIILLLPFVVIIYGAITKKDTNIVILLAALLAVLLGFFYQGLPLANGINAMHSGFNAQIILDMHPEIDAEAISASGVLTLLNRGGISAMVDAFIITFICMYFAGILEYIGLMDVLVHRVFGFVKGTGSLIVVSGIICILLAGTAGSTAVILIGGPMLLQKYKEMGLHTLNLSRTLEDFGTGSTGFYPWTSSGILYASVLGASNLTFLRYSFCSWLVWAFAIFYGFTGLCIKKAAPETQITEVKA